MSKFSAANFTVDAMVEKERKELSKEHETKQREKEAKSEEAFERKKETAELRLDTEKKKLLLREEIKKEKTSEDAEKKYLLTKIEKYHSRFPQIVEGITKPKATASVEEVRETYRLVRLSMDTQNSLKSIRQYFLALLGVVEQVVGDGQNLPEFVPPQLRLDVRGLCALFQSGSFDADFDPIIAEWDIEYPWLGQSGLFVRTFGTVLSSMIKTQGERNKLASVTSRAPVVNNPDLDKILSE